ncbi:MAG: hypothetical protein LBH70_10185 [Spirochaetaceae bacterium]|nr:hypothetical protein [Spirochaetaceae bacterium]
MQEKKAVARQVRSRYQKAGRKEKSLILDEFISITGYKNRKYALRLLNKAHCRTFAALKDIHAGLPFPPREKSVNHACNAPSNSHFKNHVSVPGGR